MFLDRDDLSIILNNGDRLSFQTSLSGSELHKTYVHGSYLYGIGKYKPTSSNSNAFYFKSYLPYLKDINNANISFGPSALSLTDSPYSTR